MATRGLTSRSLSMRTRKSTNINDENSIGIKNLGKGPPTGLKSKVTTKRKATNSVDGMAQKKRSTFGDITNAIEKTLKDNKKGQKAVPLKPKLRSSNSFNVLGKRVLKGKENEVSKVETKVKEKTTTTDNRTTRKSLSSRGIPPVTSILNIQSLQLSNVEHDDSGNYITASEGSPIQKRESRKSLTKAEIKKSLPVGVSDYDDECEADIYAVSNYAMEIFEYYKEREKKFPIKKYMPEQKELSKTMRAILVDWMVEVQETFELNHETLYLAVKLVDYYLSKVVITKDILQLVGSTSLFIACKFDERIPPYAEDFLFICDNAYVKKQLFQMEIKMLKTVNFDLGIPLSYRFLRRYARCSKLSMEDLTLARYILERSLMEYDLIDASDSALAAAALLLCRTMKNQPKWTKQLEYYSGYKVEDIYDLVHVLHNMLRTDNDKQKTIKAKYSHRIFFEVSTIPVPDELGL